MSDSQNATNGANPWTQWMSNFTNLGQGSASKVLKEWETWMSTQFDRLARNEAFLGQMAKGLESSFTLKSQIDRWVDASIKAMRMPGLSDIEGIYKRLDDMDRRLDEMFERIDGTVKATAPAPADAPQAETSETEG